ncbi:MAG: prenyltransferase, partial [Ignavibacteria bacterium]|nr:prenyltransferase [Ignavibacteria bacterium]
MKINFERYKSDIEILLNHRFINGADFWTTPDGGTAHGGPFSTLESCTLLSDLNFDVDSPYMIGAANAIFKNFKEEGKIRTFSTGSIYPCQTASAAKTLCKLGYSNDVRLKKTYQY